MNSDDPKWDSSDKPSSLLKYARWFNNLARETYLKDKTHADLFVLLMDDGQGTLCPAFPELTKDQLAQYIREKIAEYGFYAVLHIFEAWAYVPKAKNDHTFKQIQSGEIAVAELKAGDKTEAVVASLEARDGTTRMWLNPIVRGKDSVALADAVEIEEPSKGRFSGWFRG